MEQLTARRLLSEVNAERLLSNCSATVEELTAEQLNAKQLNVKQLTAKQLNAERLLSNC